MKLLHKIRHSLSIRLLLLFIAAAVVIILLFQTLLGVIISKHVSTRVAPHAHQYLSYLQKDIGFPPSIERAEQLANNLTLDIKITGPDSNWASSTNLPDLSDLHDYPHHDDPNQKIKINFSRGQTSVQIRQLVDPTDDPQVLLDGDPNKVHEVLIWTSFNDKEKRRGHGFLLVLGLILAILTALYLLIRRLFRPIQVIQKNVHAIGAGDLSHRIPVTRNDELGELATSINHMTDDIEQMLQAKRQLLLAISHELRSPLTRAKVSAALLEPSVNQSNIAHDLNEMEAMITELLEAERLNNRHQSLQKMDVTLNEIVMSVVDEYFAEAELNIQLADELPLQQLDPTRLRLVTKNLLDNALKHQSSESPPIRLVTILNQNAVTLVIEDFGSGIAAEHLPLLTEPFYREDASRQRKTGGFGLGLYLVKLIVEAHQGELKIESEVGKGTVVTINLPL